MDLKTRETRASFLAGGDVGDRDGELEEQENDLDDDDDDDEDSSTKVEAADLKLSDAEADLAVLLEEWRQTAGHRRFLWNQLEERAGESLSKLFQKAKKMDPMGDPIKLIVSPNSKATFAEVRRRLRESLAHIERGDKPMSIEERRKCYHAIKPKKNDSNRGSTKRNRTTSRNNSSSSNVEVSSPAKRVRASRSSSDEAESHTSGFEEDFGLSAAEEELAFLLEAFSRRHMGEKGGKWEFVERMAKTDLKTKLTRCKNKKSFKVVPMQFLVRRSRNESFRRYREVVRKEMVDRVGFERVINETVTVAHATSQGGKLSSEDGIENLPREYMELADLTLKLDKGQRGLWFDIFDQASPHLQIFLRKETPRNADCPPESLVPAALRPAFRAYCSECVESQPSSNVWGSVVNTEKEALEIHRRKKLRLDMILGKLRRSLDDFRDQEERLLSGMMNELEVGETTSVWEMEQERLADLMQSLEDDFSDFEEVEHSLLSQELKKYRKKRNLIGKSVDFESMIRCYEARQLSRIERYLSKLRNKLSKLNS